MDAWLSPAFGVKSANPRRLIYGLLFAFNALLWLLLIAFQWEVSLRAREAHYFGQQLFPLRAQRVPMPVIYAAFTLLTLASLGAVYRDRSNLRIRERIGTLMFQILESLEIGVVVLDRAGVLTMANESARRLLPEIPPAGAGLRILKVLENRTELKRIAQSAVEEGNYVREVEHNLGTSENAFPVRVTTLPLKDRHKRVSGALVLIHDVREVVDMERQLRTAERLSALGTLAAALAHEIRNPLEA
ncbi:MAG: PAS domain-containing protein, partial [Acidobacteria bacterium]|nr:PAS domain-containing protein [Acidobacteriota bacterium]